MKSLILVTDLSALVCGAAAIRWTNFAAMLVCGILLLVADCLEARERRIEEED